jgi:hypothetical protein
MDISSTFQAIETILKQPYRDVAAHSEAHLSNIDRDLGNPLITGQDKEKLKELRERLIQHKVIYQSPSFLGSSTCNL